MSEDVNRPGHWLSTAVLGVLIVFALYLSLSRFVFGIGHWGPVWPLLILLGLLIVLGGCERIVVGSARAPEPGDEDAPRRPTVASPPAPLAERTPTSWQDDQLAFRRRYAADPSAFGRTPVVFRWWTRERKEAVTGIGWLIGSLVQMFRNTNPGTLVALYRPEAPDGAAPFLGFEVFDDAFGRAHSGVGEGVLVGEAMRNGTLLLEAEGRIVIPRWNPTIEIPDAPGR